jgi:transposase
MVYRGGCGSGLDDECASPSVTMSERGRFELEHRGRSDEMAHFVGLDVSVKETSVCVVDDAGKVILEQKVPTEPDDIIALLTSLGVPYGRIGIEAGPLSQWLVNALTATDLPVICVETRHMKALLVAQQANKTDRNDARGIAQMMRVGLFKPVHVKTLVAQEQRMLLTSRKLLQRKLLLDLESELRGTLRNFGLKVGVVSGGRYEARVRELVAGFPRLAAIAEPLLNVRRVMRQQLAVLQKMLLDTVRGDPVCRRLMTAPGVGAVVALTYRATVDQPQRFVHSRAVGAHVGLTPKRYQSGETDYDGGVSKCGDAVLRTMLYEAAHSLLTHSGKWSWLKAWGLRVAQRRGLRRAIVAVARRLAVVLHRMWVDGSEFRWSKDRAAVPTVA